MFPMADALGLKTPNWFTNEMLITDDLLGLSNFWYKNLADTFAILVGASAASKDLVLHGLRLVWSASLTCSLQSGIALGVGGKYLNAAGSWGYSADATAHFAIFNPSDITIAFTAGDPSLQRIDIVEVRPTRVESDLATRTFRDPVTEVISTADVNTKVIFGVEYTIKLGTPGSNAPTRDAGWIKIAEVTVPAGASAINDTNIKDIRQSSTWTTEASTTVIGKSPLHINWGVDTEDVENAGLIPLGSAPTNQNPTGGTESTLTKTSTIISAITTLFARLIDLSGVQNSAIKQRHYDRTDLLIAINSLTLSVNYATTAGIANKIRTLAPATPEDGDIWML